MSGQTGHPQQTPQPRGSRPPITAIKKVKVLLIALGGLYVVTLLLLAGGKLDPATLEPPGRTKIDSAFADTAKEFERRLRRNYGGTLNALGVNADSGFVYVSWESSRCEHFDGELIDLVLSVNRTQQTTPNLQGRRSCAGNYTDFKLAAEAIREYKAGIINDSELLRRTQ